MKFVDWILARPSAVSALALSTVLVGLLAYRTMPLNLFPDLNRPTVTVVTEWPGASTDDVATEVTHPIEVRMSGLDGVRRVTSVSRDQVSGVSIEFEYGTDISAAATDVANELPRVRGKLPGGARDPILFKISDAAHPAVVLSVTAAEGFDLDLAALRRIVENPLRDAVLEVPNVAEAEVFGGEVRRVSVDLDRDRLEAHGLTVEAVASALRSSNVSVPSGLVRRDGRRRLLVTEALARTPDDLARVLVPLAGDAFVQVGDLGQVGWGTVDPTSLFRGNGQQAVALSVLRAERGQASATVQSVMHALPELRSRFPELRIEVADTQGRMIDTTVDSMLSALRDAVLMTLVVLLLFLGNSRAALVTAFSLPITYLLTFAAMGVLGYEFDMVTLTAIILAVGLLADDVVVVIENIDRRRRQLSESGPVAALRGTKEILLADASGTVSTVIVLVPIMFIGGFVQAVLRPLTVVLSVSLFASLLVSVTIIPTLAARLGPPEKKDPLGFMLRPFDRFLLAPVRRFFETLLDWGLENRALVLICFAVLFVSSARMVPVLGRELMPMMDTGVLVVNYEAEPDTDSDRMQQIAAKVEEALRAEVPADELLMTSNVVGAEPAVKSFGAARTLQQGVLTANLVDSHERARSIFELSDAVRARARTIPGLLSVNVFEFGATPLSSLRGTVDVMITGPEPRVLDRLADQVLARLGDARGLTGVERSWQSTATRDELDVEPERASLYGLTAGEVGRQVSAAAAGVSGGELRVQGENAIPVWVRLRADQRDDPEELAALKIRSRTGETVPLASLASFRPVHVPTSETHQALLPTVDVLGFRRNIAITHLQEHVLAALADLQLPRGYSLSHEGEVKQMNESFKRLRVSLLLGLALLYLMLIVTFRSVLDPLAILGALPLALIGASWAMMLGGKHGCLPAFMGFILLMGVVVNNGILLIDFAKVRLQEGEDLRTALLEAVRLRIRPILMTAGASAVGMLPVALEWAVGVERLSPLAVVAIGGLVTGTFLTLLVVPILFHLVESVRRRVMRAPAHGTP